jgi:hypothetical protein
MGGGGWGGDISLLNVKTSPISVLNSPVRDRLPALRKCPAETTPSGMLLYL